MTIEYMKELLQKFYQAFNIPVQLYKGEKLLETYASQMFAPNLAYYYLLPYIGGTSGVNILISPEYIICGYIRIEEATDKKKEQYLILGPACPYDLTDSQVGRISKSIQLPKSRETSLRQYCHYVPRMNVSNFRSMLDFMNTVINPESMEAPIHVSYQVQHYDLSASEDIIPDIHINRAVEQEVNELIRLGRVEEVAEYIDQLQFNPEVELAILAPNSLRSIKNTFIASTSIATRSAIAGGLNYDTAIMLSDNYIARVEPLRTVADVNELLRMMLVDYTRRVSLAAHPDSDSATVNAIYRDVQDHLYEKISSKDIASRLSMERTYLCHHFKNKTGMNITEYVRQQKIREAQYLLVATELPISIISDRMGFSSQQQFTAVFRQVTGETPGKYRKK